MQGYSPKLPLNNDRTSDGLYGLNKTLIDSIKQNFKMLILTNPGERVMDSNFGVGLRAMLFEQDTELLREKLKTRVANQVKQYMDFLQIEEINISEPQQNEENTMYVLIRFSVPILNVNDELNIVLWAIYVVEDKLNAQKNSTYKLYKQRFW